MVGGPHNSKKRPKTGAGRGGAGGEKPKARGFSASSAVRVKLKKSDVRFGNKEGGGTNFGSEERFAWQKSRYASDAMYTMPDVKAPPFSFGTSTRADWKKMMENTRDLYNPNCETGECALPTMHLLYSCHGKKISVSAGAQADEAVGRGTTVFSGTGSSVRESGGLHTKYRRLSIVAPFGRGRQGILPRSIKT